ncbi:MAG: exodeoxyribonuclease VII small subunit [Gammaproteobacteria bacterium]|nr:exodeoxyribonuclease VII small subunit [Gammaproteobacteria bacterium]
MPSKISAKSRKQADPKEVDFESSLEALEALVERMESGDQPLETALQDFEKGISLVRSCQAALENAELRVKQLVEKNGGSTLAPLDEDDDA